MKTGTVQVVDCGGSTSTTKTLEFSAAMAARFIVVVVFPAPPFWFVIATILTSGSTSKRRMFRTSDVPQCESRKDPESGSFEFPRALRRLLCHCHCHCRSPSLLHFGSSSLPHFRSSLLPNFRTVELRNSPRPDVLRARVLVLFCSFLVSSC